MTIGYEVRSARKDDVGDAVPMLLAAGKRLLIDIFGSGDAKATTDFLSFAWQQGNGQFGYKHHWVCLAEQSLAGLVTCWHDSLPANFDRDTLATITDHYGLDGAIDVVMRSQLYLASIEPPSSNELAMGHVAVAPKHQRKGIGLALVTFMEEKARELKKETLYLNTELDNDGAIAFYKRLGFAEGPSANGFIRLEKAVG